MQPFPSVWHSTGPSPPPHLVSFRPICLSPFISFLPSSRQRNMGAIYPPVAMSVIFAATNPAVAPPPPRAHAVLHHVHPSSLSPTIRHQHQHMYAFSKNKPTFFSRTYLCEIFPVGMSSTVRTPQASNLPRINTPTAANTKPCALSGLSPSSQPPTRHPDERSDASMQYPAHADLSTRLDSRWDILPAHVYCTTTSQRRAHIPRYDGVNSILDGTATHPPRISYQRVLEHLLLTPPPRQISPRLAASRRCYSRVVSCS